MIIAFHCCKHQNVVNKLPFVIAQIPRTANWALNGAAHPACMLLPPSGMQVLSWAGTVSCSVKSKMSWGKNHVWRNSIHVLLNSHSIHCKTNLEHPSVQPWGQISYARNPASLGTSSCSAARLIHTSKTSASAYITLYSMFLYVLCVGTCNQERPVRHAVQRCLYFKNVSCKTLVNHHLHLTIKLIRLFHLQTIKCINLQSTFKYITQLHLKTAIVLLNIQIHQIHMFSLQPIFKKHLQSLEEDVSFRKSPFFYTSEEPLLVHHPDEVLVHWYRPLPLMEEIWWTPVQVDCLAHWWRWRLNLRAGW